jgi:hypothetical protein
MLEWILKYWVEALMGLIYAGLMVFWKRLSSKVKKNKEDQEKKQKDLEDKVDAATLASRALLHRIIIEECTKIMDQGYCTIEEFEEIEKEYYEPYKALNGNGSAERAIKQIQNLPPLPPHGYEAEECISACDACPRKDICDHKH